MTFQILSAISGADVAGTGYRMDRIPIMTGKVTLTTYPFDRDLIQTLLSVYGR